MAASRIGVKFSGLQDDGGRKGQKGQYLQLCWKTCQRGGATGSRICNGHPKGTYVLVLLPEFSGKERR